MIDIPITCAKSFLVTYRISYSYYLNLCRSLKKGKRQPGSIGFVADERRINVGLTRARCSLLVIGNARALQVLEAY